MTQSSLPKLRILVVDDEQPILDEFKEILCPDVEAGKEQSKLQDLEAKLFGTSCQSQPITSFELEFCHQGDEAVNKVEQGLANNQPFAVAFLDVRMPPGPDGVWTAEHIRELDKDIQLVIVTAYSDVDPLNISNRVLPADKLLYLQKPFHPHEIRQFASALGAKWLAEKNLQARTAELEQSNEQLKNEIEEHKRTEKQRKLLAGAVKSTDDCVYITDMGNKIIFVNRSFCDTYGYDKSDVIGQDCRILWKENNSATDSTDDYLALSGWEVAFYHQRKDGSSFPVALSRSSIKDEQENEIALVAVARDISERIMAEQELKTENLKLKRQNQLRTDLAVTVSQELTNLLTNLKNIISDLAANTKKSLGPELSEKLKTADENINGITEIACNFLDIAQSDNSDS